MKEKLKNKKVVYTIIGIVSVLLVALALTYAYWLLTKEQTGENVISSACLDIEITGEKNDIELGSQYPIADSEGEKLTPYEFTVTNKCDSAVDYQIALETMPNDDGKETLSASALKVMLDANAAQTLDNYYEKETTISGATSSNMLGKGTLAATGETGSSATHKLRIWIDANAPIGEMNRTFTGKISVTIGQGIVNTGTLADAILASNGGSENIRTITSNELIGKVLTEKVLYDTAGADDSDVSYYFADDYELNGDTNQFKLKGNFIQSTLMNCNQTNACDGLYTVFSTSDQEATNTQLGVGSKVTAAWCVDDEYCSIANGAEMTVLEMGTDFSKTSGMYKAEDDLGTSFYFRGAVENNYVKFGKWSNSGKDMYWRIVRINGDGTIRLFYHGTKDSNGAIGNSNYSTSSDYTEYINGTEDSLIKTNIDNWYRDNLYNNYRKYISDGIFCGNANSTTNPSLICSQNYKYTVSEKLGNGKLTYPVGLINVDEIVLSGSEGIWVTPTYSHYLSYSTYWTMNPGDYGQVYHYGNSMGLVGSSGIGRVNEESYDIRPVINLRADVEFTGTGEFGSPYEVVMN